ncbi:nuclear RNA export factor 2-like [Nannospalax galili]|nr:nuclear RNA export factor 2-like [Nannospalax galili]
MYHQQKYALPLQKYGNYSNEEYSMDNRRVFQQRGRNYTWHKFDRKDYNFEHTGAPYAVGLNKKKRRWNDDDRTFLSAWDDRKHKESKMSYNAQNGTRESWFKVTIPSGRNYDKTWLMNSIMSICSVPFTPVDFHYDKNQARFFVQDASTASALKDASLKICDEENQKIIIFVRPSIVPYSVKSYFTPKQMEQIKLTMMKRYDVSQKSLDLRKFRFDRDLMSCDIDMMLNRRCCMNATLQIIQSNIPELLSLNLCNNKLYQLDGLSEVVEKAPQVKILNLSKNKLRSVSELEKVKELKLEELWLEGNPLCRTFQNESAYASAIRDQFPTLIRLDGKELLSQTVMNNENPQLRKESYKEPEIIRDLVVQFLKEYYSIYDSGDRHGLLSAYHDEACFSLTIPFNSCDSDLSNLEEYFKHNRDLIKLKDSYTRMKLLKHTNRAIVDSLSTLPKTQHDFYSFWVDMSLCTEVMLCFSVNGVFKEVEGKYQGCVRAFTRTFVTVPKSSSSMYIINDKMILRNSSPREIQKPFIPLPTVSPSLPKSTLSEKHQEMVKSFSEQSGMKLEYSQKCLDDNEWDYTKASKIFSILQTDGKIPKEFFK